MAANEKPVALTREDMRKALDILKRTGALPPGRPPVRRALLGLVGEFLRIGVLEADLEAGGVSTATIWGYYPDDAEHKASEQTEYPVDGWLLTEGTKLVEGTRIVIAIIGAAAYALTPGEFVAEGCIDRLDGREFADVEGYVAGQWNFPAVNPSGCLVFVQPSTDCP